MICSEGGLSKGGLDYCIILYDALHTNPISRVRLGAVWHLGFLPYLEESSELWRLTLVYDSSHWRVLGVATRVYETLHTTHAQLNFKKWQSWLV